MDTIDITDWRETGEKLSEAIYAAVKDTQRIVIQELPHMLRMTSAQFDMFKSDPDYSPTEMNGIAIWITPMNVMEIHVSDVPNGERPDIPKKGQIITSL